MSNGAAAFVLEANRAAGGTENGTRAMTRVILAFGTVVGIALGLVLPTPAPHSRASQLLIAPGGAAVQARLS